jgi:hypothetical protein
VLTEAGNFPDLARFYLEEMVDRGKGLLRRLIERGVKVGEFRSVDVESAVSCSWACRGAIRSSSTPTDRSTSLTELSLRAKSEPPRQEVCHES